MKHCPLLSAMDQRKTVCIEEECAWWVVLQNALPGEEGVCAIALHAQTITAQAIDPLNAIGDLTESIRKDIDIIGEPE